VKSSLLGSVLFYTYENLFDITKNKISNFSNLTFQRSNMILDLNNENTRLISNSKNKNTDDDGINNDNISSDKNKSLISGDMTIGDTDLNRVMDEDGHSFACVLTAAVGVGAFGGMTEFGFILMHMYTYIYIHMNIYIYMYIYKHI
jgi:hypothetical protein